MGIPETGEAGEKSIKKCIESGKRLDKALREKLAAIKAGSEILTDIERHLPFDQIPGYRLEGHYSYTADDEFSPGDDTKLGVLRDLGVHKSTKFIRAKVFSLGGANEGDPMIAENSFSQNASGGVIIAEYNEMHRNNITPVQHRIKHWSELLFRVITNIYPPNDVPEIKYIIRNNIRNPNTWECIKEAHKYHIGKVSNGKATFDPSTSDAKELNTYHSLLGSPNGVGVAHLLKDYPATFRQRKIVKTHTWMTQIFPEDPHLNFWRYDMAFELGPA